MSAVFVIVWLPVFMLMSACDESPVKSVDEDAELTQFYESDDMGWIERNNMRGGLAAELAPVRRLTAPYHNSSKAEADGWIVQLSPCVESPSSGGMGYHYGNPEYLQNGIIDALKPEVLVYEPTEDGELRLVAVEYIAPFGPPEVEGEDPVEGDQPSLFGQDFDYSPHVGEFGAWTLHVWLWRNNPEGMFAEYNPKVSCDYAF